MQSRIYAPLQRSRLPLLSLVASSAVLLTGCGSITATDSVTSPAGNAASIKGSIHGGNQPVSGATVNLRFAGQGGPMGAPNAAPYDIVATTTSASDGAGSFSFSKNAKAGTASSGPDNFSCPVGADPLVYVEALGGDTLNNGLAGVDNKAAVFIAPLGLCSAISSSTFVNLSELTTTATMAALAQYFDPVKGTLGRDGIGNAANWLQSAFDLVPELADLATGVARPSFTITGGTTPGSNGISAVTVVGTPEMAKLNELANIISSCVNTSSASSTACTTLFANAMPPNPAYTIAPARSLPAATDVRQALYYIFTNPTNGGTANLKALYDLAPAVAAPYQPALTSVPTDWTLAINYASSSKCGGTPGEFISSPSDLGIDKYGNVWFANNTSGNLSAITPTGTPFICLETGAGKAGGIVDTAGEIWTAGAPTGLVRYDVASQVATTFATTSPVLAMAADGSSNSNIYFSTAGALYVLASGDTATSSSLPVEISSVVGSPARLVIDSSTPTAIWSASGANFISRTVPASTGTPNYLAGYSTTNFSVIGPTYGIAVSAFRGGGDTPTNNVFVTSGAPTNSVTELNGSGTSYTPVANWPTAPGIAGLNNPTGIALDAAQSAWIPNLSTVAGTPPMSSITELGEDPATGSPVSLSPVGFQKAANYLSFERVAIVDPSGNIWVAGDTKNSLTEVLGAGAAVYQPASLGLNQGRFQTVP